MLVRGPSFSDAVCIILARAIGQEARATTIDAYREGRGPALFGWAINGAVVSVAGIAVHGPEGELVHIATDPSAERHGHAAALIGAAVQDLQLTRLIAETDDDAVGFYRRTGFTVEPIDSPWPMARYRCTLRLP